MNRFYGEVAFRGESGLNCLHFYHFSAYIYKLFVVIDIIILLIINIWVVFLYITNILFAYKLFTTFFGVLLLSLS